MQHPQPISHKVFHWLSEAIQSWENQSIISQSQGQAILDLYMPKKHTVFITLLVSLIGVTLIGGGVILLTAHNWDGMTRTTRTLVSFTPLLLSQGLLWWAYPRGLLARESIGILHALGVGASIALISQTYQTAGDLSHFLSVWALLLLPIAVLFQAQSLQVATLYLTMSFANEIIGDSYYLWVVLAVMLGLALAAWRGNQIVTRWFYLITLSWIGIIIIEDLEWSQRPYIYLVFASVYYLLGIFLNTNGSYWKNPLRFVGTASIFAYALIVPWLLNLSSFTHYQLHRLVEVADFKIYLAVFVLIGSVYLAKKPSKTQLAYAAIPVVFMMYLHCIRVDESYQVAGFWLVSAYLLAASVLVAIEGQMQQRTLKMNAGLVLAISTILARFFDPEASLILSGSLFIAAGIILLTFNAYYLRKTKRQGVSA